MLPRIEYSVVAPAPQHQVWQAFCDLQRLLGRGIYQAATWIEGAPWQVGSRLRYLVTQPVEAVVNAVVTEAQPPNRVGLLNHGLGVTAQQTVTFRPTPDGSTRVTMSMEFIGNSELPEPVIAEAIQFFTHDALDTMVARIAPKDEMQREVANRPRRKLDSAR